MWGDQPGSNVKHLLLLARKGGHGARKGGTRSEEGGARSVEGGTWSEEVGTRREEGGTQRYYWEPCCVKDSHCVNKGDGGFQRRMLEDLARIKDAFGCAPGGTAVYQSDDGGE